MRTMAIAAAGPVLALLAGCQTGMANDPPPSAVSANPAAYSAAGAVTQTQIDSEAALQRLKNSRGMTLQWISWDYLGPVAVADNDGVIRISASQQQRGGPGKVTVLGDIVRIEDREFIFRGRITMTDTPDAGRQCVLNSAESGDQIFAITQNRQYWRLRTFEWCDGLTDYIDIYF